MVKISQNLVKTSSIAQWTPNGMNKRKPYPELLKTKYKEKTLKTAR